MPSNSELTDSLLAAWCARDIDAIMSHFAEDARLTNLALGPAHVGKEAIRLFIAEFLETTPEIDFVVHHQVEGADGVVMNERTEVLLKDGQRVALPVMGIFEYRDGKLQDWREYFDLSTVTPTA